MAKVYVQTRGGVEIEDYVVTPLDETLNIKGRNLGVRGGASAPAITDFAFSGDWGIWVHAGTGVFMCVNYNGTLYTVEMT